MVFQHFHKTQNLVSQFHYSGEVINAILFGKVI